MTAELSNLPEYKRTIEALEAVKRTSDSNVDYWYAREIMPILAYDDWRNFLNVIDKAKAALVSLNLNPLHHIVDTNRMMERGNGANAETSDMFLDKQACRLIAMNGDSAKPEIAGAQAYFVIQAERMERVERDEKRVEMREKVTVANKKVGDAAFAAGLPGKKFPAFHGARYQGLYNMSLQSLKAQKGIAGSPLDHAGALELSANEFQMNMAANAIENEKIKGAANLIKKNREIAQDVRKTMSEHGVTMPENLPVEEPIKEVKKRLKSHGKKIA